MEDKFPPLEIRCEDCKGKGYMEDYTDCYECDRVGYLMTPFGEAVLAFVKKRYKITVKVGR